MPNDEILGLIQSSIDAHNAAALRNDKAAAAATEQTEKMKRVTQRTLLLLGVFAVFFLVTSGSGIGMISDLYANKMNKDDAYEKFVSKEVYKAVSKLSSLHYNRIVIELTGDSLLVKNANMEYNYAIQEIIDHGGTRSKK